MDRTDIDVAGSALRILVVEDHEINQRIVRSVLEKAGYAVTIVGNGRLAVEAVQHESFDLVLMDIQMPEMDGPTATRAIRALDGAASRLPIVALTANSEPQQLDSYRAAGMDDCVTKPISPARLLGVIVQLTQAPGQAVAAAPGGTPAAVATLPTTLADPVKPADPLIDEVRIARISEAMGAEAVGELLSTVASEARHLAAAIAGAVAANASEEARRHAQTLKGMAGNMAATRISRIAQDIGREAGTAAMRGHLARLDAAIEETALRLAALAEAWPPAKPKTEVRAGPPENTEESA